MTTSDIIRHPISPFTRCGMHLKLPLGVLSSVIPLPKRKKSKNLNAELLSKIKRLEHSFYTSKSKDCLSELIKTKIQFNKDSTENASLYLLKTSAKFYGGQNKSGKLLANYLKLKQNKAQIESIIGDNHISKYKDSEILHEFVQFYKSLYTPENTLLDLDISQYLSTIQRTVDPTLNFELLETDITQAELLRGILTTHSEKYR